MTAPGGGSPARRTERARRSSEAVELGSRLHDDRVEDRDRTRRQPTSGSSRPAAERAPQRTRAGGGELLFTGAAPLPPETLRFFAAIGVDLCECYGPERDRRDHPLQPGRATAADHERAAAPGCEGKIEDDGELLLRGPMVMRGYRGKPELTAAAIDTDGWLRTGDVFVTDEAGYYRIIDRKKEIIVCSAGKNISPASRREHVRERRRLSAPPSASGMRARTSRR